MKKRTATKHTTGHIFKRGKTWYCQWRFRGKTNLRVLKDDALISVTTKAAALEARDKLMARYRVADEVDALRSLTGQLDGRKMDLARLEDEANPPLSIADAWTAYDGSPSRPDSGESTLRGYKDSYRTFSEWITEKHPDVIRLRDVTPVLAAAYSQSLTEISASTFNQRIGFLRLLWRVLADEAKTGGANPWTKIARRKLQALVNRKRALTPVQFDAIHAAAASDPDLQDLFTVLAWTGQRLIDGLTLRWEAVNFPGRVITLYPVKTARRTGKAVHIPIFEPLMEVLNRRHAAMPHTTADAYVFPRLVEDHERDATALSKRIQVIIGLAGIKTTEKRTGTALKRAVVLYGAHSFRHLFVTAAASAGLPAAMIKAITGHATDAMSEHYQQFDAGLASEFALRLTGKAPAALPAGRDPIPAWAREKLAAMTGKTWKAIRDELLTA